ncbi:MAG: hypothetical protein ACRCY3_10150 [Sphingorhabdus sp.]
MPRQSEAQAPKQDRAQQDQTDQQTGGRRYKIRQVTDYQVSWTAAGDGEEGRFTMQLILDKGVEEHILEVDSDDLDVMLTLLKGSDHVMWDSERQVMMFENLKVD